MNTTDAVTPFVSVVLCTYNRVEILKGALRTLCHQPGSGHHHELIIVDNNSSDKTKECSLGYSEKFDHVRYVFEQQQGLSHARNRGLEEARGEYIAFIDDDCEVPEDYIVRLIDVLRKVKPAVLGGPAYPFYKSPKPGWYRDKYAQYQLDENARALDKKEYAYGFNMVFRCACLEAVGGFDPELGMTGDDIGYGEDIVPQRLIREKMPAEVFYYDPQVRVFHLVRPEKMTLRWVMQAQYHQGKSRDRIFGGMDNDAPATITVWRKSMMSILGIVKDAIVGLLARDKTIYPCYQNYLYEHTSAYFVTLGKLHQNFQASPNQRIDQETL
jgi:glycosyltransferase involved in cell wall biosynthesis